MDFLLLLVAYGVVFALMNDKLGRLSGVLRSLSFLDRMFECAFCTGFHAGWGVWIVQRLVTGASVTGMDLVEGVLFGFASASFSYTLDTWLRWLETRL